MNKEVLQQLYENGGPELNYVCGLILQNSDEDIDKFTSALFEVFHFAGFEAQRVGGKRKGGGKVLKAYIILCFVLLTAFSAKTCTEGKGFMWNSAEYNLCKDERFKELKDEAEKAESQRQLDIATIKRQTAEQNSLAQMAVDSAINQGLLQASDVVAAKLFNENTEQQNRVIKANTSAIVAGIHFNMFETQFVNWGSFLAKFLLGVASAIGIVLVIRGRPDPRPDPRIAQLENSLNALITALAQNGVVNRTPPSPSAPVASAPGLLALLPNVPPVDADVTLVPIATPVAPAPVNPTPTQLAEMVATIKLPPQTDQLPGYNAVDRHTNFYNIPENTFYPHKMTHVHQAYHASSLNYRLYIRTPLTPVGYTQIRTVKELNDAFARGEGVGILWTRDTNSAGGKSRRKHKRSARKHKKRSTRKH